MKKLKLDDHAYMVPMPAGIGAKNTISNGADNGANNNLAAVFWQAMRHGTTAQAASNGITRLMEEDFSPSSTGEMNIGGHGNEGLLETGAGQSGPFDENKYILLWTEYAWGPELDKIKPSRVTQVSIWSCHTGAGQDGADLLFAMAKRCGRAVRAGTGFLYSNGKKIWWENGAVWQVATPTNKPAPIQAPSPHKVTGGPLEFAVGGREVGIHDITSVDLATVGPQQKVSSVKTLAGNAAQSAVSALFQPPALELPASVMAFATAELTITFGSQGSLVFRVYNDRLAVHEATETAYYLAPGVQNLYRMIP